MSTKREKLKRLGEMAATIDSHCNWWRFPQVANVKGFLGTDPVFFVGDQPSLSDWGPWHPHCRGFYGLLEWLGVGNVHLTDIYKRRGPSESLKSAVPTDFNRHMEFFREEVNLLRPRRIVALGQLAHGLLTEHAPELKPILRQIWHFSYAARRRAWQEWGENARRALSDA